MRKIKIIQETTLSDINLLTSFINVIKSELFKYLNITSDEYLKNNFSETYMAEKRLKEEIIKYNNYSFKKNLTSVVAVSSYFNNKQKELEKLNLIVGRFNNKIDRKKLTLFVENIFQQYKKDFTVSTIKSLENEVNEKSYLFLSNCFIASSIIYSILKEYEKNKTLEKLLKEYEEGKTLETFIQENVIGKEVLSVLKEQNDKGNLYEFLTEDEITNTLDEFLREDEIKEISSFIKGISVLLDEVQSDLMYEKENVKESITKDKLIQNCMALSLKLEGKKVNSKNIKEFNSYLEDLNKMSYLNLEEELNWLEEKIEEKTIKRKRKWGKNVKN